MMRVNPYLFFSGNCEEAFTFYHKVLGGKITAMMKHRGTEAEAYVPADWVDKVMHAALDLGEDILMGSDSSPDHQEPMQSVYVSLQFSDADEGKRIFDALAEGGTVKMPFTPTFFSAGFGMLEDRFGARWMVNAGEPSS
ncbi:VOC family protein [Bauldia litoralis]|uniref:VOC family protein n=1 Tax=Bauldia litoralis TaxID=665467 RepID=UPI003265583A